MNSSICLRFFCSLLLGKNIEILCLKIQRWMILCSGLFDFLFGVIFLKEVNCAMQSNNARIEFGLIDMDWRKNISRPILARVEYWLSRSNEYDRFRFCTGKHFFTANRIYPAFFVCPHGLSFLNHEPLHIFRVNPIDEWGIKFRALNNYVPENPNKPFLFYDSFDVSYQLFETFAKYMTFDASVLTKNVPYELFYKLIKLTDLLDPISSDSLRKFYLNLYKNGLMNPTSSADIVNDSHNYRTRYFSEKMQQRPFMYFFGVLNDSLDACLIPDISTLSIFQKKNQYIDQCFRYTENVSRLVLKISASSLELLMSGFTDEMRIFNWLLSVTEIAGFYLDDTEYTFNPIKCQNICGFLRPVVPTRSLNLLKTVPSDFFLNISEENQRRIAYLRFVNIDICFDLIETLFNKNNVSFLEVAYCSVRECHKITEFLVKMPAPDTFKLRGVELRSEDLERILCSRIKVLVLDTCTLCQDSVWTSRKSHIFEYEIMEHLRTLSVSSSKLPVDLIQLLLNSMNLKCLNISCFEFLPANSSYSMVTFKGKWKSLQVDKYIPNDSLKIILKGHSVYSLSVSKSLNFIDVAFFFNIGYFSDSVKTLDLSDSSLTVDFLTLIDNFQSLKSLNLSASLPLSTDNLPSFRMFETTKDLDVSRNDITSTNYDFISKFARLRSLSISESKIEKRVFVNILTDIMIASLASLDLSGVDLDFSDFERLSGCEKLKSLYFRVANDRSLSHYCELLVLTPAKNNLCALSAEIEGNVSFDDLLSLAGFLNLSEVKITCFKFLTVHSKNFMKFHFLNPQFRLELCLREYTLDIRTLKIFKEMFNNYSFSIVSK